MGCGDKQKQQCDGLRETEILAPREGKHSNSQRCPTVEWAEGKTVLRLWVWMPFTGCVTLASPVTSMSLSFPACKMGSIMVLVHGTVVNIK